MTSHQCSHETVKKFGFNRNQTRRYRCPTCKATFSDAAPAPFLAGHNTDQDKAVRALGMMLEGMSIRAISRLTGLHKNTILSLMVTASGNAQKVFDAQVRRVRPKLVQLDEFEAIIGRRGKNVEGDSSQDWGNVCTWLAMDSASKMILSYYITPRTSSAYRFLYDLSERTLGVYRIAAGRLRAYVGDIEEWYGADVNYSPTQGTHFPRMRVPHIERSTLVLRMHIRRFAHRTNAVSKKLANLKAAVDLFVVWYDFCRVHHTLRVTPAMEAGVTDHVWTVAELLRAP